MRRLPRVPRVARVRFPFADSSYEAEFRLVGFKLRRDFATFQFATVDPS
jgi:hypothetical protein